jgi:hypothetical protein
LDKNFEKVCDSDASRAACIANNNHKQCAMPFEKGKSGNPRGRKKGTQNAVNRDLRERVRDLLESQFEQVAIDLAGLEPRDRVNAWLKLSEFVLPKLQRSETVIDFSKLSDAEIDTLFERAMAKNSSQ